MHSKHSSAVIGAQTAVFFIIGIYAAHWWVYHIICQPSISGAVVFNICFFLAVWSYLKTSLTDPGTPASPEWKAWASKRTAEDISQTKAAEEDHSDALSAMMSRRGYKPGRVTWCKKCQIERPERAHHCSQCGLCILRMDHHCPWVGTCIGWLNQKYFVLMTFWTFALSLSFLCTMRGPTALEVTATFMTATSDEGAEAIPPPLIFCVVMAIAFALVTGGMFVYSFSLVARNLSTIEEMYPGPNPYSYPSSMDNIRQFFGRVDSRAFVPVEPKMRISGTQFPLVGLDSVEEEGLAGREDDSSATDAGTRLRSGDSGQQSAYGST